MSKKTNTVIFLIAATIVNILIMIAMFLLGLTLLSWIITENTPSTLAMALNLLLIIFSVGGTFLIYNTLIKFVIKKFNLEDKMDPVFNKNKK